MKDKIKFRDERDTSGTNPIPILSLALRVRTFCSLSLAYPWPHFYYLQIHVGIVEINEIEYIVADNKLKHGKFLPGMKIPIISKENVKGKPDYALVLAWNFLEEIKKKNSDLAHKFISIKDLER